MVGENGLNIAHNMSVLGVRCTCVEECVGYTYDNYKLRLEEVVDKLTLKKAVSKLETFFGQKITIQERVAPMTIGLSLQRFEKTYPLFNDFYKDLNGKENGSMLMGVTTDNQVVIRNIKDTKSILVAGASGGGKSVFMNTLILSLIGHSNEREVELNMIDLKQTELTAYAGVSKVKSIATTYEEALDILNSLNEEIDVRYSLMKNKGIRKATEKDFPISICFIDEYAMLTSVNQEEIDKAVARIASVGRACNVYLVIATQHPTNAVISNVIRANIQSRVCLRTLNTAQSVAILGCGIGTELLGKGDAFIQIDGEQINHIQGFFIRDQDYDRYIARRTNSILW